MGPPAEMCMPGFSYQRVPPRVEAAQNFLHYANGIRNPCNNVMPTTGDTPSAGGELNPREMAAYNAALNVLTQYFNGEMDFGDVSPTQITRGDDDPNPRAMVPA